MNKIYEKIFPNFSYTVFDERPPESLITVEQVHGSEVLKNDQVDTNSKADGIILSDNHNVIAIKTADCLPVVIIGEEQAALVHAGWKGLAKSIFSHPNIKNMKPTFFYIGPSIKSVSYEIQKEFLDNFKFLPHRFNQKEGKFYFDLQETAKLIIESEYPEVSVNISNIDTFTDTRFHSFRRNKTTARNWNLLKKI